MIHIFTGVLDSQMCVLTWMIYKQNIPRHFKRPLHRLVCTMAVTSPNPASLPLQDRVAMVTGSSRGIGFCFSVNCRGTFLCCKEAANRVKQGGGGRIIMLSSSLVGSLKPNIATYTASKAAVETMTKILAKELKGTGITANCVAPDMFLTGISEEGVKRVIVECPHGRLGQTKDVVPLVGFLASDAGEWINGQVIGVNGGIV